MVRILIGDVRAELAELADESVHCVVTSPPYWGLRDYGVEGQLGLEPTIELYVQHMVEVFREVRRVLRKDGTLWLNMGDCYAASKGNMGDRGNDNKGNRSSNFDGSPHRKASSPGAHKPAGWTGRDSEVRTPKVPHLKPKDLVGQPWRVAFALQGLVVFRGAALNNAADLLADAREAGDWESVRGVEGMLRAWARASAFLDPCWLRSDIVWAKRNPMPESCRDRPTKSHEYVFMLTKSGAPTFWTHRDKAGTCTAPKPDYIWIDRAAEYLDANMAELWGQRLAAGFKALGFTANLSTARKLIEHREEPEGWKTERFPRLPKSWPAAPHDKRWKRLNLWTGHDYFFDQEAVREKGITDPKAIIARVEAANRAKTRGKIGEVSNLENWGAQEAWSDGCRNIRSVWTIPTQPSPEAHFATFPEALPERCIKAGTSERGCCTECGAPWVRVVEKSRTFASGSGKSGKLPSGKHGPGLQGGGETGDVRRGPCVQSHTIGWRPSCKHKGAPIPCTVLDPFMGAGTTALVALKLGRAAIGIELNPEYAEMARRRLEREVPLLADLEAKA